VLTLRGTPRRAVADVFSRRQVSGRTRDAEQRQGVRVRRRLPRDDGRTRRRHTHGRTVADRPAL